MDYFQTVDHEYTILQHFATFFDGRNEYTVDLALLYKKNPEKHHLLLQL
jgi:hypothetical protein